MRKEFSILGLSFKSKGLLSCRMDLEDWDPSTCDFHVNRHIIAILLIIPCILPTEGRGEKCFKFLNLQIGCLSSRSVITEEDFRAKYLSLLTAPKCQHHYQRPQNKNYLSFFSVIVAHTRSAQSLRCLSHIHKCPKDCCCFSRRGRDLHVVKEWCLTIRLCSVW